MKQLLDFKDDIHKCSKCGICQGECPIYKITGNDCAVSRGQFVMLKGVLQGDLRMSKTINRYLDLCLKCGACTKFCPSGIDVVDVIIAAKSEYFKLHPFERIITFFQKYFIFGLIPRIVRFFIRPTKSEKHSQKVLYFGGCGSKLKGDKAVVRLMNKIGVEVVNPMFHCCGMPYFSRGDLIEFSNSLKSYIDILKKYNIKEVLTTCASCENTLKNYAKWSEGVLTSEEIDLLNKVQVKNIYEYLKTSNIKLKLKQKIKATYHKPCHINNFEDINWLLENTENLEYIKMNDFDKCCGLNGLPKFKEYPIISKIINNKRQSILKTESKRVLTSCLGCEIALKSYSLGAYRTEDLIEFLAKNVEH